MDNTQVNFHNACLKVSDFLDDHSADTALVAQIAVCESELNDLIDKIIIADGAATEDTSGTTETKNAAREAMIALTLKCCNAAMAHATATGDLELLRKVDFTPSELNKQRDSVLHTTCRKAYTRVSPLGAALIPFLVVADDLTDWDEAITLFLNLLTEPGDRIDDKKLEGQLVDLYQAQVRTLLDDKLDVYMNLFLPTAPMLVAEYKLARAIDNLGGSPSLWVHEATVPAAEGVNTPTFSKPASAGAKLENTGATVLSFQLADASGAIGSAVVVNAGQTWNGLLSDMGTGGDRFKVTNPDLASQGSFRISIG